jgi:hypothetical protein
MTLENRKEVIICMGTIGVNAAKVEVLEKFAGQAERTLYS